MNVTLSPSCIEVLKDTDLCTIDNNDKMAFSHPYFCPTSYLALCNMNTQCNMSPVLIGLFN